MHQLKLIKGLENTVVIGVSPWLGKPMIEQVPRNGRLNEDVLVQM